MCCREKEKSIVVVFVFVVQCLTQHTGRTLQGVGGGCFKVCVGGFSVKGTPGPVPIPVAKFDCADGTAIVGLWESKTPPTLLTSYVGVGCVNACRGNPAGVHTPHTFLCFRRRKAFLTSHRCITA